jgi:hypothetical protein
MSPIHLSDFKVVAERLSFELQVYSFSGSGNDLDTFEVFYFDLGTVNADSLERTLYPTS